MIIYQFAVILLAFFISFEASIIPSIKSIERASDSIRNLIISRPSLEGFPFIAGFVRLSFHDCIGPGGCDGCINHNKEENGGLKFYTAPLDGLYKSEEHNTQMSRADFYAIASLTSLEMASFGRFKGFKKLKVGRKDCSNSPAEDEEGQFEEVFPHPVMNIYEIVEYYDVNFGMSARESIALLGAHTLGRSKIENSGYEGRWINPAPAASRLNNAYYRVIMNVPWHQVFVHNPDPTKSPPLKIQWQPGPPPRNEFNEITIPNITPDGKNRILQKTMLFNSDVALYFNFSTSGFIANCFMCGRKLKRKDCCQTHKLSFIVKKFAQDNNVWLKEFSEVFLKMINHKDKHANELVHRSITSRFAKKLFSQSVKETIDFLDYIFKKLKFMSTLGSRLKKNEFIFE